MAVIPCDEAILCPGSDFPITNYSSEGPEQRPLYCSVVYPTGWDKGGCMTVCCLEESQNAADLCALGQEAACPPKDPCLFPPCDPAPRFCSVATTCSCESFDGSEFFYTTPAGTFCASTQEAADALAHAYACEHCSGATTSIQIVGLDACTCFGAAYSSQIAHHGVQPTLWIITDGALPDGVTMNEGSGFISGTPTTAGTFTFTVRAFTITGNYATKTMTIAVIEIVTATIDPYTLGVPYSFQLQAAGGSGSYAWRINSGTLPTGLTMTIGGLISGTPTAVGTSPLTFQVIDLVCESTNRTFFVPQVSVASTSNTIVRTRRGYGEYIPGDGTLYKRVTYTGYATQKAYAELDLAPLEYAGGAKYVYSGYSAINNQGQFVSSHRKDLFVNCLVAPTLHLWDIFQNLTWVNYLLGYCWPADPTTCAACSQDENDWSFKQNDASHSPDDKPLNIIAGDTFSSISPTSYSVVVPAGGTGNPMYLGSVPDRPNQYPNPINFPISSLNGISWYYVQLRSVIDYTATLSDPFTDADAIAGQLQYTSNGRTSENKPDTLIWNQDYIANIQSKYTSVNFVLTCTNLLDGEAYTVRYELWDSNGTATSVQSSFTAIGTTHAVLGTLPTPAAGHSITLRNVRIAYT